MNSPGNSVQYILNGALSLDDKIAVKKLGRPTPNLQIEQINITQKRTFKRSFNRTIYENYPWLCGCKMTNKFYCFPCILASSGKQSSVGDFSWTKHGMSDLKHLDIKAKSHMISKKHLEHELEICMLGRVNIRSHLSDEYRDSIKNHNKAVDRNRYILSKLIESIKFCGAFELMSSGHDENPTSENPGIFRGLVNLMAEIDTVLKAHFNETKNELFQGTSKTIQNELLDSILNVCQDLIKKDIQAAKYISIQAVASTEMQIIFTIRYVIDGQIYERFWGFLKPRDHTADGLSVEILEVLSELEIDKVPEKLIAQSYDGASIMSSIVGDVQAKIKSIYTNGQFIHCYAHQLDMMVEKCCSIDSTVRVFFANLSAFSDYFSHTTKRTSILDRNVKKHLPHLAPTQWNFTSKCVNTIYIYKEDLITCLEEIMNTEFDKNTINQTKGLINYLKDDEFNFWLFFFSKIMPTCDILFDQLQSRPLDALKAKKNISNFSTAIQNIRNNIKNLIDEEWHSQQDQGINIIDNIDSGPSRSKKRRFVKKEDPTPNLGICKEICDRIVVQVNEQFSFNTHLTIENLFDGEKFKDHHAFFPNEDIRTICSLFPKVNSPKLKNELSILYTRDDFVQHNGAIPLLQMFFENNLTTTFSECVELLTILCTIPMITVESERCFSTLKHIKTFLRNTMSEDRLCALAMLSIEKKLVRSTPHFNDLVINHFASQKSRLMDFNYKK